MAPKAADVVSAAEGPPETDLVADAKSDDSESPGKSKPETIPGVSPDTAGKNVPLPDDDDECLMDTVNTSALPLTEENKSKTGFKDGIKPLGPASKRKDQVSDK